MLLAPDAVARRRPARRRDRRHMPKLDSCGCCPTVFKGEHVRQPSVEVLRGASGRDRRRSRPFTMYADGDPIAELPVDRVRCSRRRLRAIVAPIECDDALDAKIVAARAVGELARRARRGGGTSLPGKVLTRLEPHAIERARRPGSRAAARSSPRPTARRRRRRWPPRCSSAPGSRLVHNRAGANMAGGVASTLLDGGARGRARSTASWGCSRSTSSGLTGSAPQLHPRAVAARQPVPRPARPLRRARDDRRPLGGDGRGARRRARSSPATPTTR